MSVVCAGVGLSVGTGPFVPTVGVEGPDGSAPAHLSSRRVPVHSPKPGGRVRRVSRWVVGGGS